MLFLAIPGRVFGGKRVRREEVPESAQKKALRERLGHAADALRELYDSMNRTAPAPEENPAVIFDRAAERVCRGCALCELCWQKEYTSTFNALNDATPFLLERGKAKAKDFPQHFADRCIHLTELLQAVNGELSAFLLRKQYRRQLEETRRSAKGQYAQMSDLLSAAAAGLGETRTAFGEKQSCDIGAALRPKEGELVCGDTMEAFRTGNGVWCLLLADGMGSGEEARADSGCARALLEKFLRAGLAPEEALATVGEALALRGEEQGGFAAVDLFRLDLFTGSGAVYKLGAAATYVRRKGAVERLEGGGTLPAGGRRAGRGDDRTVMVLRLDMRQ